MGNMAMFVKPFIPNYCDWMKSNTPNYQACISISVNKNTIMIKMFKLEPKYKSGVGF